MNRFNVRDVIGRRALGLALLLAAVGVLFLAVLPALGWGIPESTATMLASFFGAFVAVIGAAVYSRSERRASQRQMAHAIGLLLRDIPVDVEAAIELRSSPIDDSKTRMAFEAHMVHTITRVRDALNDLEGLRGHMGDLPAISMLGVVRLLRELELLKGGLEMLHRMGVQGLLDPELTDGILDRSTTIMRMGLGVRRL